MGCINHYIQINISKMKKYKYIYIITSFLMLFLIAGCSEEILEENPTEFLTESNTFTSEEGFEAGLVSMYSGVRDDLFGGGVVSFFDHFGTDITTGGEIGFLTTYDLLTPIWFQDYKWNWAYLTTLPSANMVIQNIDNIEWSSEENKNRVLAEARFGRAYVYNVLANSFGGVPIVSEVASTPKLDYVRASRLEVLEFARQDLMFAAANLPSVALQDGRASSAAANHLLTEVYLSMGRESGDASFYDSAIQAASNVIDGGDYQLITERFGSAADQPGDYYSDIFKAGNQDRASGNTEVIFTVQFQFGTPGGQGPNSNGNFNLRVFGPRYFDLLDPNGEPGFILTTDSIGRGIGWARLTPYFYEQVLSDPNDMRNSQYNIRRDWYYNNPDSEFFGQLFDPESNPFFGLDRRDTIQRYFPMIRKVEGPLLNGPTSGGMYNDHIVMRLSETYLLRAEAYMLAGNTAAAAEDINVVRTRANATPITAADVDIDFILDERARELIVEEQRRRTLSRTNMLYDRVSRFAWLESIRTSVQPFHNLLPIPQSAIDANTGAKLEQNPGYN